MLEYMFNNHLILVNKNDKLARFWTMKKAKREAIRTANDLDIDFVGVMTIVSRFWFFKNKIAALVTRKSAYGGQLMINADGTLNEKVKTKLQKEQHITFK